MASKGIQSRLADWKHSVKGFIRVQHQESNISGGQSLQEHLNTSSMVKVLVIGETGSGKSTFINYLTNYFKNGTLHDLKVAIPSTFHSKVTENFEHHEHDVHDKTQSKTDSCNQYMFTDGTSQYLFIDTPGLSDTRGAEQDKINLNKIIDSVETLAGLTAIIIVVNGAIARLTVNLRNVIAQMRGNLPDIVMDNVIVVLTNSTRHTFNFELKALALNGNVYPYFMQNSAFSTDPAKWTPSVIQSLQYDWDQAMNELKAMVTTLNTFKTKSVSAFKNMRDIRNAIKALMHAARVEVSQIQKMQDEIAMFEAGLKQANADTVTYKDYTRERMVDKVELVDATYHSTLCQNCNHVCHDKCGLTETTAVGAQIFQQCWAMKNGNCTECQHKCSYTAHYHAKKTVKTTKQKLEDVLADIKSRYDAASKDATNFQKKITSTADAKKLLEKALQQKNAEIKAKCNELRQICSGFNLAAELHALIDQLEIESSMLRNIDTRRQADAFIRSLKEFCATIEKDQDEQQVKKNQNSTMNIINTEQHVEGQVQMSYGSVVAAMVSNENSNTSVTNSEPYASNEVLDQIRAISRNSSNKNEKQESKETLQDSAGSSNECDQSENDISKESTSTTIKSEVTTKNPSKAESSRAHESKIVPNVEEIKKLRTPELLTRYRACEDQRTANFIVHELKQRSHGKSMAPLTDPADIIAFTTSTQKYCSLDTSSLKHTYEQLKDQICAITEPDILEIEKVSSILLYEIAAVHQLLKNASESSNISAMYTPPKPPQPLPSYQQQQPLPPYQQQQPLPPYQQQQPLPPYQQQQPLPPYQQYQLLPPYQQQQPLPPYQQQQPLPSYQQQQPPLFYQQQQPPLGYFQQYPYQQPYQPNYPMGGTSYLPNDRYDHISQSSKFSHSPSDSAYGRESIHHVSQQNDHLLQPGSQYYMQAGSSEEPYRQSPIHKNNEYFPRQGADSPLYHSSNYHHSQGHQQQVFQDVKRPIPMLASRLPMHLSSSASELSNTFDKMHVSSSFRPVEPNRYHIDSTSPRSRASSSFSESNSRANSAVGLPFKLSVDELRGYTDSQLVSAYDDATQKKNRSHEHAIYAELERRCYGDHPLLIKEKRMLFDDKCRTLQEISLDELKKFQSEVEHKIYNQLSDGNAANLISIPHELIIEAAVLSYLIGIKASQG